MKISELNSIDPENKVRNLNLKYVSVCDFPFCVSGVFFKENDGFLRIDREDAAKISSGCAMLSDNTAGGRVRFKTDAKVLGLSAIQDNNLLLPHIPLCAQSGFDIYAFDKYAGTFMPKMNIKNGFAASVELSGEMLQYTINFPLYDNVKKLFLGFPENAEILPPDDYKIKDPIVFYGSSITQGASASRPGNCYVSRVCRNLSADYLNLGFAANCKGEKAAAEYIASLKMSAFVMALDYNLKDQEELNQKHFEFYKTVREKNPDLPILLVSVPNIICEKERYEGRRAVIETTYQTAKANGDNVFFIDGETLFAGDFPDTCTVDGVHPNDLGFYRMANVISKKLNEILK